MFVGTSTVISIEGNKFAPALGDRYLGKNGYDSQQTDQPEDPNRPDNLWHPLDEEQDHGARGAFDARANTKSWQLWFTMHRRALTLLGFGLTGALTALAWRKGQ